MKKKKGDIFKSLIEFKKNILEKRPSNEKMWQEVRMMRFMIRPLKGDIRLLNQADQQLIEILWGLGKLEEFFQKNYRSLDQKERKVFFQLFDSLYKDYQERLKQIRLKEIGDKDPSALEMEIFRSRTNSKKYN